MLFRPLRNLTEADSSVPALSKERDVGRPIDATTAYDLATLKIIIVGTPKTGNTWVKHLLSVAYELPIVPLGRNFSAEEVAAIGPRWIAHQHFLPTQDLMTWGLANHVVFITAVRHPGDVLVSLWHHVRNQESPISGQDHASAAVMRRDEADTIGAYAQQFVEAGFHLYLNLSVAWMRSHRPLVARYEALWDYPGETLRMLTRQIISVSNERIELAISSCELSMLQSLFDPEKKFYRQGGVGAWLALPAAIKERLRTLDPYPQQFAALGYSMDESAPENSPLRAAPATSHRFGENRSFHNGVPIPPVLMKIYFGLPQVRRAVWSDPCACADSSFFQWLNQPAAADRLRGRSLPVITELASHLYTYRPDLSRAFPDIFGVDRWRFHEWFLFTARREYALDHVFFTANPFRDEDQFTDGTPINYLFVRIWLSLPPAVRARWPHPGATSGTDCFLHWLNSPAAADPSGHTAVPTVTELGAFLHSLRPDVAHVMPDLFGRHRVDFSNWFISSAREEYALGRVFTLPVVRSWAQVDPIRDLTPQRVALSA